MTYKNLKTYKKAVRAIAQKIGVGAREAIRLSVRSKIWVIYDNETGSYCASATSKKHRNSKVVFVGNISYGGLQYDVLDDFDTQLKLVLGL